jgi:murein peptide amidase A
VAGVHGDEVEGTYLLQQLFSWLKDEETSEVKVPLVVIPILNVDGYRVGTRGNAHGVDLNRNYPAESWTKECKNSQYYPGDKPLSELENQYLLSLFNKYPPALIITFHAWKPMINYNGDCRKVAAFLSDYNTYPVVEKLKKHPTPGSLGEYAPSELGAPVLTFEAPLLSDRGKLKDIWEESATAFKELLQSDLIQSFS